MAVAWFLAVRDLWSGGAHSSGRWESVPGNEARSELLSPTDPTDRQPPKPARTPDDKPRRVNVAVTPDAISAIEKVIERENVTLTEAVRRLLNYGYFVYRAVKEEGGELELQMADGTKKEVVFI
jgi:hypothetical protein